MRVTAVRRRRVLLPDGVTELEQTAESAPSPAAAPLWTLDPDAEVARLAAANAALHAIGAALRV